jgi:hypothetical protein
VILEVILEHHNGVVGNGAADECSHECAGLAWRKRTGMAGDLSRLPD